MRTTLVAATPSLLSYVFRVLILLQFKELTTPSYVRTDDIRATHIHFIIFCVLVCAVQCWLVTDGIDGCVRTYWRLLCSVHHLMPSCVEVIRRDTTAKTQALGRRRNQYSFFFCWRTERRIIHCEAGVRTTF